MSKYPGPSPTEAPKADGPNAIEGTAPIAETIAQRWLIRDALAKAGGV